MHAGETAYTGVDRVTKGQHPALTQQHVVGQRKYHRDPHLVHDCQRRIRGKDEWHHRKEHRRNNPRPQGERH